MTDRPDRTDPSEPDPELDPELDAATEAAVRRTLAEAGGPVATPDAVVARLDATLADLVAERRGRDPEAVVIALDDAARSRRTRVRLLLGAAAAVVVVGVTAGVLGDGGQGGDAADSATALSEDAPSRDSDGADGGAAESQEGAPASPPARSQAPSTSYDSGGIVAPEPDPGEVRREVDAAPLREVRADRLRDDLVALQNVVLTGAVDYSGTALLAPADFVCKPAAFGVGRLVGVEYDGGPAVVAFRPPSGSTQVTEVLACGTADVLHSTTLPTVG